MLNMLSEQDFNRVMPTPQISKTKTKCIPPTSVKKTLNLSGKFDINASGKLSQPEEIFYVANIVNAIIIICINTCMPGSRPGCPSV